MADEEEPAEPAAESEDEDEEPKDTEENAEPDNTAENAEPNDTAQNAEQQEARPANQRPSKSLWGFISWISSQFTKSTYRRDVICATGLFLLALEVFRELKCIAIPLMVYMPFRKMNKIVECAINILWSSCS